MPDNAAMVASIFEAWERRDYDAVVKDMTDDVMVSASGVDIKGKADVKAWYASWAVACPDGLAGAVGAAASGDTAVIEGLYTGTNTGPFGPFPATGRTVSMPWANVYRFNGAGKIIGVSAYHDTLLLMTQLGHAEPLPQG
jgi:steroid delta-isomerase-like uncharacterized protein